MRGLEPDAGDCCRATSLSAPFMLVDRWGLGGLCPYLRLYLSVSLCAGLVATYLALCGFCLCCTLMPCGFIYKAGPRAFC
jgi:hypothetical protein